MSETVVKRFSSGKDDWESLRVDEHDHLCNVWTPGDVRVTFNGRSVRNILRPCNANAKEMRIDVKKRVRDAFYITPDPFDVYFPLANGRVVSASLKFRTYVNEKLTEWICVKVSEPSRNYTADDVSKMLAGCRLSGREDVEELFTVDRYAEAEPPKAETTRLEVGSTVLGKYVIERELGAGGMGKVFLAEDVETAIAARKRVVLKVLHDNLCSDERSREMFIREANTLSDMRDDRIAACYEFQFLGDTPILVMEFIEGVSLDQHLKRRDGVIGEDETRELLRPIAAALDYAHRRQIFHLDVKPLNIIVRDAPKAGYRTCLLDFGISKKAHPDGSVTMTSVFSGTPAYMSPDQMMGEAPSSSMDVYSLAVTAYECMTGLLPYPEGRRKNHIVEPMPSETPFASAVMRVLRESAEKWPRTCRELVDPPAVSASSPRRESAGAASATVESPLPADDVHMLQDVFRKYRIMLADSAKACGQRNAGRAEWLRSQQARLRDLVKDIDAAGEDAFVGFFEDVRRHVAEEGSVPDDFFCATSSLVELRCGLPRKGGKLVKSICDSVK